MADSSFKTIIQLIVQVVNTAKYQTGGYSYIGKKLQY